MSRFSKMELLPLSFPVQFYLWACSTTWRQQCCCDQGPARWRGTLWPKPQETGPVSTEDWWWAGRQYGAPKVVQFKFALWFGRMSRISSSSLIVIVVSRRMINDSALKPTKDMFMKVALEIFSDGKFNWGRVVALFYFACRLVIKVRNKNLGGN